MSPYLSPFSKTWPMSVVTVPALLIVFKRNGNLCRSQPFRFPREAYDYFSRFPISIVSRFYSPFPFHFSPLTSSTFLWAYSLQTFNLSQTFLFLPIRQWLVVVPPVLPIVPLAVTRQGLLLRSRVNLPSVEPIPLLRGFSGVPF